MKFRFSFFPVFIAIGLVFVAPLRGSTQITDWNIAVLDELLTNLPAGQTLVQVDDMEIPVSYLTAWRNQLAGVPSPFSTFGGGISTWTGGNVYYTFSSTDPDTVPANLQKAFLDAAGEWATFANLHFIPRTTQSNYVTIEVNMGLEGGLSAVGMVGGQQFLDISPDAWNRGTICHEIGHTLGLVHEHQRSDRDSYVTILTNNVESNGIGNFVLLGNSVNEGAYDFLSVMHYARNYLSVTDTLDTIEPLPAYTQFINLMGVAGNVTLSDGDRAGMAAVYGIGPTISSVVTNTQDSGPGTFRTALYYAYDHPGTRITFNIPTNDPGYSNGVFTIQPSGQLPWLVNNTIVDGGSQPKYAGSNTNGPLIQINGALVPAGTPVNGIVFNGTNSAVYKLVVNGFDASGVLFQGPNATGNVIGGCYLGIDPSGTIAVTNDLSPVTVSNGATGNIIGGIAASNRNVISGSAFQGVVIRDPGTQGNVVAGNYLGLNAAGTAALPNGYSGVGIVNGAQGNIIGPGNIISGNAIQGVAIRDPGTTGNLVEGNYIGLNPGGTAAIPNAMAGVEIFLGAQSNIIGGTVSGARNIISGNTQQGVSIDEPGTAGNVVEGNYLGLNPSGNAAIPNGYSGVGFSGGAQSNIVGGTQAGAANVISGNSIQGVAIRDAGTVGNVIEGNIIGLNPAGTAAIPNAGAGVEIFGGAELNVVGGTSPGARNIISGNSVQGVALDDAGTAYNLVEGNVIGLNAAGNAAVPNASSGVEMFYSSGPNVIGSGNVISGNIGDGVLMDSGASSNIVRGNFVGLDTTGSFAIPNTGNGVETYGDADWNVIGGIGVRNFISGNAMNGVRIVDSSYFETVQGNTIGLNAASQPMPNHQAGVGMFSYAQSNVIGGTVAGQANLIADNGGGGVELYYTNTFDISIRGNSIYGNTSGSGISLSQANNSASESTPALVSAVVTTNTTVSGNLMSLPSTTFHLDFYANPPPAYAAQAATYLGAHDVVTGAGGTVTFTNSLAANVPIGYAITASATDPSGNTSSFSAGLAVTGADSVGDGITDAWRKAHFGGTGTTTNSSSCATCDPDHDGLDNLKEFLAGTDPNNSASGLRVGTAMMNGTNVIVSFNSVAGITYRIEFKNDLTATNWSLLADQIIGAGGVMQFTDSGAALLPTRFYRVDVLP